MTKTITIFDNQNSPKFGAKFNGSIEDTDTYETIGYVDFLAPSVFLKKLSDTDKTKWFDAVYAAENNEFPIYLSFIKSPIDKQPIKDGIAFLTVKDRGIFTVSVKHNGEFGDEVWVQQHGNSKNRYVGFDNAENENNLGKRIAV